VVTRECNRRQQQLREVEGYLDLLTALSERWPLTPEVRDRLAQRALDTLDLIEAESDENLLLDVHYLRGETLRAMTRFSEAIVSLHLAAELSPGNVHTQLALGWCYKRTARLDLAIEALENGLIESPDEAILHYNLACYWSLAGNKRIALEFLSNAIDIDSTFRGHMADESDFDPIRDLPEFRAITNAIA